MKRTVLINGKAGSLKTKGVLVNEVSNMINQGENVLMLDTKEEYYKRFRKEFAENGYNIVVLNLKNLKQSNGYNPYTLPLYYYINDEKDKAVEMIETLGKEIFLDGYEGDPFWPNMSIDLFTGLSLLLFKEAPHNKVNFGSLSLCADLVSNDKEELLTNYIKNLNVMDPIYACVSGTLFAPADTRGSIISVFREKIKKYCLRENLMAVLSNTDFDIANLGKEKTAVFIIARDDSKNINEIANLFIEQIYSLVIFEDIKFNFVFDNIEKTSCILCLKDMLNMLNKNMKIYVATRNRKELEEM